MSRPAAPLRERRCVVCGDLFELRRGYPNAICCSSVCNGILGSAHRNLNRFNEFSPAMQARVFVRWSQERARRAH